MKEGKVERAWTEKGGRGERGRSGSFHLLNMNVEGKMGQDYPKRAQIFIASNSASSGSTTMDSLVPLRLSENVELLKQFEAKSKRMARLMGLLLTRF